MPRWRLPCFPEHAIRDELLAGTLKPLPMCEGGERYDEVYLIMTEPDAPRPGVTRMAEILREDVARLCPVVDRSATPPA